MHTEDTQSNDTISNSVTRVFNPGYIETPFFALENFCWGHGCL